MHEQLSTFLAIREMQMQTKSAFFLTTLRMTIIKKIKITNAGKDIGEKKTLCIIVGM
jgi:hypothetical protein